MSADLWKIVQSTKTSIQKLVRSNISAYSCIAAAAITVQTCSQSQAAEEALIEFAHLTEAGQKFFTNVNIIYENELKIYNLQ